jgi:hypothetical protein
VVQNCARTGWGNEGELVASLGKRLFLRPSRSSLPVEAAAAAAVGFSPPARTMTSEVVNVCEYEELARQKLPKMVFDYYASGAEDQWTLKERIRYAAMPSLPPPPPNPLSRRTHQFEDAFLCRFRPRILIDVTKVDLSTNVLGFNISMPIMVAPTAMQRMAHPDGELATARAVAKHGTIMVSLPSNRNCSPLSPCSRC